MGELNATSLAQGKFFGGVHDTCDGSMTKTANHCMLKGILCATQCSTLTHLTLEALCMKENQDKSTDGACDSSYSCEISASTLADMANMDKVPESMRETFKSFGTQVLETNDVSFMMASVLGSCAISNL